MIAAGPEIIPGWLAARLGGVRGACAVMLKDRRVGMDEAGVVSAKACPHSSMTIPTATTCCRVTSMAADLGRVSGP